MKKESGVARVPPALVLGATVGHALTPGYEHELLTGFSISAHCVRASWDKSTGVNYFGRVSLKLGRPVSEES